MLIEHNLFILKILEKIKEMRLKFSQGSVAVYKKWQIMKKQELNQQTHN